MDAYADMHAPPGPDTYTEREVCAAWDDPHRPHAWRGGHAQPPAYGPPAASGPLAEQYCVRITAPHGRMLRRGADARTAELAGVWEFVRAREDFPSLGHTVDFLVGVYGSHGRHALQTQLEAPNECNEALSPRSRDRAYNYIAGTWLHRHVPW